MSKFAVILPAAGKSSRFRDPSYKKPFIQMAGRAVWLHSADLFLKRNDVKQLIVVIAEEDQEDFHSKFGANLAIMGIDVVSGGKERADSVGNALAKVRSDVDYVAIHDAARPCLCDEWIDGVFAAAEKSGAAILATPVAGTLKRSKDGKTIDETVSRANLWEAQTPQVFRREILLDAYAKRGDFQPTDEAELVEKAGYPVSIVPGSPINLKITTKQDLALATQALKALPKPKLNSPSHPFAGDDLWR